MFEPSQESDGVTLNGCGNLPNGTASRRGLTLTLSKNPRTSQRINFVGGIRGTGELEKRVDSGEFSCAFSMFPTRIEQLMAIADAGGVMPPKSTWFEPKLRDAMFCHLLGN